MCLEYQCCHGKEVPTLMRFLMIPVLGLALALSASPAFAFGGGGGHSATVASGGGATSGGSVASDSTGSGGSGAVPAGPPALFAGGVGLPRARFLRRPPDPVAPPAPR